MKKSFEKGFTLIELLVVIAIIGILSTVVLASLNGARQKAKEAKAKATINQARAAAEMYYNDNAYSYLDFCSDPSATVLLDSATKSFAAANVYAPTAGTATGATGTPAAGAIGFIDCDSSAGAYKVQMILKDGSGSASDTTFCVDSTGKSEEKAQAASYANSTGFVCI